eukprot:scaffold46437_cov18-Tisochrysis_lutea.AAC.1
MVTSYHAKTTSSSLSSSCSHLALRSRHGTLQRTSAANCVKKPHYLGANRQHVDLLERKSYASGSYRNCCVKEGPTLTTTGAQTRNPPPPGRGQAFDSASHFNPLVAYPPKWVSSVNLHEVRYCEHTRPGQQLDVAQRQYADLSKNTSGQLCHIPVMLYTIPSGCCWDLL